ncbi:MAG: transporter [Acidimicrobiales bacterium]|nr:MAG: transporter [Acidimicrobiales bacterium]
MVCGTVSVKDESIGQERHARRQAAREVSELLAAAKSGDRGALARLLTMVERGGHDAARVGRYVFPLTGTAYTVGITGAPGAGKSTLTSALVGVVRSRGLSVGVLAVDPTSPFSGGAILGDRIRMGEHALDQGVFIRSMATRGHLGGLSLATPQAVRVLDAAGCDVVFVETVGVGQVEVEVVSATDTTVVVLNPGWGDAVQANKAGLMEIADVFVINKSDRPGVDETRRDLEQMLDLAGEREWRPPIVLTVAHRGEGVEELWERIEEHRRWQESNGRLARRRAERLRGEVDRMIAERLREMAESLARAKPEIRAAVERGELDPWTAVDALLADGDAPAH